MTRKVFPAAASSHNCEQDRLSVFSGTRAPSTPCEGAMRGGRESGKAGVSVRVR